MYVMLKIMNSYKQELEKLRHATKVQNPIYSFFKKIKRKSQLENVVLNIR